MFPLSSDETGTAALESGTGNDFSRGAETERVYRTVNRMDRERASRNDIERVSSYSRFVIVTSKRRRLLRVRRSLTKNQAFSYFNVLHAVHVPFFFSILFYINSPENDARLSLPCSPYLERFLVKSNANFETQEDETVRKSWKNVSFPVSRKFLLTASVRENDSQQRSG